MELSQNEGYNGEVCMITDLNKILVEWAYRTNDGQPNSKNSAHIIILERVLNDFGWSREVIDELLNNLVEKTLVKNKKSGAVYLVKNVNDETHDVIKKDASEKDLDITKVPQKLQTVEYLDKKTKE